MKFEYPRVNKAPEYRRGGIWYYHTIGLPDESVVSNLNNTILDPIDKSSEVPYIIWGFSPNINARG